MIVESLRAGRRDPKDTEEEEMEEEEEGCGGGGGQPFESAPEKQTPHFS